MKKFVRYLSFLMLILIITAAAREAVVRSNERAGRLEILFLGHTSNHHASGLLADILSKEYFNDGINITYTVNPDDLNDNSLRRYDGLIVYANYDSITPRQEKALLNFVKGGKGFMPLHCASHCFRNSAEVVSMIGGQFKKHGIDSFSAVIVKPDHPVVKNVGSFVTTDETYEHDNMSPDIEVLTERVQDGRREPYTWVKKYGNGRVFYTAYGHDEKTFNNPSFLQLVKNGILWAVGEKAVRKTAAHAKLQYSEARIPNYEKRNPPPKFQAPLTPEQSMSLIQVPVDFELELFAAEPDIVNPIYMNWDERGRLWVIETVDYPNTVRDKKEEGDDRIKILEDTDNDGRADKFTIFADKLNIPTSFVFTNGGIVVSQAPYFLYIRDSNGDDHADTRDTIMTGWGTFDTHAGPSNLRYGIDNKLWGTVGYSGFAGKFGKDSLKFSQGVFRFPAVATKVPSMEFVGATSNNTWGLGFSEEFDVFASTANNTHSVFVGVPKKYLDKAGINDPGTEKIDAHYPMHVVTKNLRQVDVFGGFTAAAGHSLYTARTYPREYWNRIAFVCEPTGRLIHKVVLKKDGAGFKEDGDGWNMLASSDEWVGPVQAETGPDGHVWVADWYDFIIQHNPTPEGFVNGRGNAHVNPLRDRDRGRIYRIKYRDAKPDEKFKLSIKDVNANVSALKSDNMFWRTTAQRLLVEANNKSVLPALYKIIQDRSLDATGINAPAMHAIWTLHGMNELNGTNSTALQVVTQALQHPSAGVRRAAVQTLPITPATIGAFRKAEIFNDRDLRVRLAAVLAVAELKQNSELNKIIKGMQQQPANKNDRWVGLAMNAALHSHPTLQSKAAESAIDKKAKSKIDQVIVINVVKNVMKFDKELIEVKAGSTIQIRLNNPDFMQHNLLVLKPNTMEKVGKAADQLAAAPEGEKMHYVPDMPEVIAATPLVDPEGSYTLTVKVPAQPGDYPYICSFPGHWRIMKGMMKVK